MNNSNVMANINKKLNKPNFSPEPTQGMDWVNIAVFIAIALKTFGLIPLVIRVARTQSAEDISYITPIMFLLAFLILCVVSIAKKVYAPILLFLIGITASVVLLIQKIMYENNKTSTDGEGESKIDKEIMKYHTKFKFPDPNLNGLDKAKFPKK